MEDERKIRLKNIKKLKRKNLEKNEFYNFVYVGHFDYLKNAKQIVELWSIKKSSNFNLKLIGRYQPTKYFKDMRNQVNLFK